MADLQSKFFNAPVPQKAPVVPYTNADGGNPLLRGVTLAAVSKLISASGLVQGILWKLNKFDQLKEIPGLIDYEPRCDPTVIPTTDHEVELLSIANLPRPAARKDERAYYTCADYHALYKAGKLTPSEVIEELLTLIQRREGKASRYSVAYLSTNVALVRDAAKASTERYQKGQSLSDLDGVPVAVKDEIDLKGHPRTLGSRLDLTNPRDETGWCVQLWQQAGAIIIGKTNMHEVGADTTNNNPTTGTPLNPHNEAYYTGGSSGGSACTIAQGICPIALGADGGGSIRLPSSFCGVFGLKPSHGRVSGRPTRDLGFSVGVYGPMASSIDDLALAYRIMAQPDPESKSSAMFPNSISRKVIEVKLPSRKVVGVDRTWVARSDPEVLKMFDAALHYLDKVHGYEAVDISIPLLPENQKAHAMTILSELRSGLSPSQVKQLSYPNQILLNVAGSHASAQDFLAAQRLRDSMMKHLAWLWKEYPGMLILTPTTPCAGWKIKHPSDITSGYGVSEGDMTLKSMEYVYLANWTGAPAISCPMGYAEGNVPVGIMAMSEWGSEEHLLAFGKESVGFLEEGSVRRPQQEGIWVDVLATVRKV